MCQNIIDLTDNDALSHQPRMADAFFFCEMVEGPLATVSTQPRDCVTTLCEWRKHADLGEVVVPRMHHGKFKIKCGMMK